MIHRRQVHEALLAMWRQAKERGEVKDALILPKDERRRAMPVMSESVAMWIRAFDAPQCEVYENGHGMLWRRGK